LLHEAVRGVLEVDADVHVTLGVPPRHGRDGGTWRRVRDGEPSGVPAAGFVAQLTQGVLLVLVVEPDVHAAAVAPHRRRQLTAGRGSGQHRAGPPVAVGPADLGDAAGRVLAVEADVLVAVVPGQ